MIYYFSSLLTGGSEHFLKFIICDSMSFLKPEYCMMLENSVQILLLSILSYVVVFFFFCSLLIFGYNEGHYINHHIARIKKLLCNILSFTKHAPLCTLLVLVCCSLRIVFFYY